MPTETDWNDFKVLLALAQAGSVTGAARALQVDNSTISRRLTAMELSVGAKLLVRGGRDFCWTAEGRTLLATGEAMAAAALAATRSVRMAKEDVSGTVRISIAPGFLPILMRLMLPALKEKHPALNVELSGAYQCVNLAKGETDIAVRMTEPDEPDLVARRTFDCGWFVYASANYLSQHGQPTAFSDLAAHRLVLYVEAMHSVAALRWMEAHRGAAQQVSRADNLEVAMQIIAADGGIAVLPCMMADAVPNLRRVFPNSIAVNTGWVVYHETVRGSARVRVVVDALMTCFDSNRALFLGSTA